VFILERERYGDRERVTHMEFAAEFTVGSELDVDAFVEAEPNEIQRLLHCAIFLACHSSFYFVVPLITLSRAVLSWVCYMRTSPDSETSETVTS
jgi:hypothetical protein